MKTKQFILKRLVYLCILFAIALGCSKDGTEPIIENLNPKDPVSTNLTFDSVVGKGGDFENVPESRLDETLEEGEVYPEDYPEGEGNDTETKRFICRSRTVSVTDGTGDFQTLGGAASEIYPGALLQGKTINNVKPQAIPLKRAGGAISYSLNDGNLAARQDIDEMSESKVRQAMNNIIAGKPDGEVLPANFDFSYENVYSEEQVALNMGLSYEGYGVKAKGKLSFSTDKKYNRVLVKLNQTYYDVSYDFPTGYADVFDKSVTPKDLEKYIQADNPATYIKKVTYGRIFYMLIESTSSLQAMNTEITASYDGFKNKIDGKLEVDTMKKMENLKIKVIAYGGDSKNTFASIGETNVEALATMLSTDTNIATALPLSYEIYSLEDPSKQVGTNISTEMTVVECELKGVLPPVTYSNLVDLFDDGIGAATQIIDQYAAIFNGAGTQYVIFNASSGAISEPYSIKDENAPLGVTSFDHVGAALRQFLGKIYIFNETGTEYEVFGYDNNALTGAPTSLIGAYTQENGANKRWEVNENFSSSQGPSVGPPIIQPSLLRPCVEFPLFGAGIKAAVRRDVSSQKIGSYTIFNGDDVRSDVTVSYYYSNLTNGSTYSRRNYYNPLPFGAAGTVLPDFNCWEVETKVGELRGAVEAACKIKINDLERMLFFTTDGLLVVKDLAGDEEGPWAL